MNRLVIILGGGFRAALNRLSTYSLTKDSALEVIVLTEPSAPVVVTVANSLPRVCVCVVCAETRMAGASSR